MKKNWEENKNKSNNVEVDDENLGDNFMTAETMLEFKDLDNELTNEELSVRQTNEKMRI